ncbi:MAG: glycosyltransferase family 4 protein, partial [Dehalococcoidia bacterium]
MRISIVAIRYPHVGGGEVYAQNLSTALVRASCQVEVFTTDPTGTLPREEIVDGVEVHRYPSRDPLGSGWCFSPRLYGALKRARGLDLIHCHKLDSFPTL